MRQPLALALGLNLLFATVYKSVAGTFETFGDVRCLVAIGGNPYISRTTHFGRSAGAHASPSVDDVPPGLREVELGPAGCRQLEYTVTQPGLGFLDSVPSRFIKL